MLAGRLTGAGDYEINVCNNSHLRIIILTCLFDGSVGFLLEEGRTAVPLGGWEWSLPVNLFKLINKSDGMKSFGTAIVFFVSFFAVPSINGRRQPLAAVCPCAVEGTTLPVAEVILAAA